MSIKPDFGRLLIVDDEIELMTSLCEILAQHGFKALGFTSGKDALDTLKEQEFDILLTDLMMPDINGIDLIKEAQKVDPNIVGIMMTGQGTVQTAVEAMKTGAFDYVLKPFKINQLLPVLSRAIEIRGLRRDNIHLRETMAIYELNQAIAFTFDANTILNKVADSIIQQFDADEMSIMFPSNDGKDLFVAIVRGEDRERLIGEKIPIEQGIAGWVACHHETLTLQGEINDSRFSPFKSRPDIKSSISMPMLVGGKLIGILNVSSKKRDSFNFGKVKALSIFASTAASALENAWLYSKIHETEKNID